MAYVIYSHPDWNDQGVPKTEIISFSFTEASKGFVISILYLAVVCSFLTAAISQVFFSKMVSHVKSLMQKLRIIIIIKQERRNVCKFGGLVIIESHLIGFSFC